MGLRARRIRTSWRRWTAADIDELMAARLTLEEFMDLAAAHDDEAAFQLVYPASRALWGTPPSEVAASFRNDLGAIPGTGLEFGIVATARIIHREEEGEPDLVAFGYTALAGTGIRIIDGPRLAKAIGLIYEHDRWWVWGTPTPTAFAAAELVHLPHETYGSQELASVVALEWLRALEPHLLAIWPKGGAREATTQRDRGHAMACIAILAFALEAAGAKLIVEGAAPAAESIEAIAGTLRDDGLREEFDELLVLRNSVAHGHVWRVKHEWGPGRGDLTVDRRAYGREDVRYRRVVPVGSTTTRRLGLHVVPGEVAVDDVRRCIPVAVRTFDHLATFDGPNALSLADIPLDLGGSWRSLRDVAPLLES